MDSIIHGSYSPPGLVIVFDRYQLSQRFQVVALQRGQRIHVQVLNLRAGLFLQPDAVRVRHRVFVFQPADFNVVFL